jgi:hypothetical protein
MLMGLVVVVMLWVGRLRGERGVVVVGWWDGVVWYDCWDGVKR